MLEKTVLIVEDDGVVAMDMEEELTSRGWHVVGAVGTEQRALDILEATLPNLAVLDINLRGKKSYGLAELLIEKGVAVMFVSGNTVSDLPQSIQMRPFLQKPVNYNALEKALLEMLDNPKE